MKDIKAYIDNETISKVNGNFFIEEVNRKKKEEVIQLGTGVF